MKVIELGEGQSVGDALAEAGAPEAVISLVSAIMGEDAPLCDCPPGVCLGESTVHEGSTQELFDEFEDDNDDGEFTVDFQPDFELPQEALTYDQKVGAVAQLGRIIENVTIATEIHARLLQDLVD